MVWIGAKYKFASTFSYRIPYFSSSYALSAPAPSPSTIKLALVASTINRTGDIEKGKKLFEKVSTSNVTVELPDKIVLFKAFMKRLKKKRQGKGFERTFGIREYVLYDGDLGIYLDTPKDAIEEISSVFKNVQYFGTSDSICLCLENALTEPTPKRCIKLHNKLKEPLHENGVVFLLSDFTETTSFEDVNPFSGKKMKKGTIVLKPYLFPIKVVKKDRNCTIYHLT
jgi:CRISPR-associated Cas5-like protein